MVEATTLRGGGANNCHDIIHDTWSPAGKLFCFNRKAQALESKRHEKAKPPMANPQHVQVQALAAGTLQPLGAAEFICEQGHLVLTAGTPHAGRYLVTWKQSEGDK